MAKFTNFKRRKHDAYFTPLHPAVPALIPHLPRGLKYCEPCAGRGDLIAHLEQLRPDVKCCMASDLVARTPLTDMPIILKDALTLRRRDVNRARTVITNPPWTRTILHPMLEHFLEELRLDVWFLLEADWMHTAQAAGYIQEHCDKIVSIGRIKWIEKSNSTGMQNYAWYHFRPGKIWPHEPPGFYVRPDWLEGEKE